MTVPSPGTGSPAPTASGAAPIDAASVEAVPASVEAVPASVEAAHAGAAPIGKAEDPGWKVAHLPFLSAVSAALMLVAASVGYVAGGTSYALGAALGVLIVTVSFSMTTLVVAWADTVRPALLMPLGLTTYVVKYGILGVVLAYGVESNWSGKEALGWGIVAAIMVWTGVQIVWFTRMHRPSLPDK